MLCKKIITWTTLLCLALAVGMFSIVAAASPDNSCPPPSVDGRGGPPDMKKQLTESLHKLVQAGTITEEQSSKIISFMDKKMSEHRNEQGDHQGPPPERAGDSNNHSRKMIEELMQAANLTVEQAQAVEKAIRPPAPPNGQRP